MRSETAREQLFFSTVYIEAVGADGDVVQGTAFIYTVNVAESMSLVFLVSNKHVMIGAEELRVNFLARSGQDVLLGERRTVSLSRGALAPILLSHPVDAVDVAVLDVTGPVSDLSRNGKNVFMRALRPEHALDDSDLQMIDAVENVLFMGYPSGIYDKANLLPVARGGRTATPIEINYEGLPAFLIDASVFPGSSGSPVFIADDGSRRDRSGGITFDARLILLGVLAAVHVRQVSGEVYRLPTRNIVTIDEPIDLGIVFKASTFIEIIDAYIARLGLSGFVVPPAG